MDGQSSQHSPSLQSSVVCSNELLEEMKGNDDIVQHEIQPIPNAPEQKLQQPISNAPRPEQIIPRNEVEPIARMTYPCQYCDKIFSTSMALGGHQNAHRRLKALAKKRQTETPLYYQPYPIYHPSYNNPYRGLLALNNKTSYLSLPSASSPCSPYSGRLIGDFHAKMGKTHPVMTSAPPPVNLVSPATTGNMFFGVRDFFGASGSARVMEDEAQEEDASGLDLDLKL